MISPLIGKLRVVRERRAEFEFHRASLLILKRFSLTIDLSNILTYSVVRFRLRKNQPISTRDVDKKRGPFEWDKGFLKSNVKCDKGAINNRYLDILIESFSGINSTNISYYKNSCKFMKKEFCYLILHNRSIFPSFPAHIL